MQSQLQMISPINDNHQYEEIIKSSEAVPKLFKPTVLIPVPEFDNFLNILTPKRFLNNFFAGKEKPDVIDTPSTKKNNWDSTTPIMEVFNGSSSQKNLISTKTTTILEIPNSTTTSFLSSNLDTSKYNQNSKNLNNAYDINNYVYNITSNDSFPLEINELPTVEHKTSHQNHKGRKKRSLELFFISDMLVSER